MKILSVCIFAVILVGCSSPPKQPEPSGKLLPVYVLQDELNERPMWRSDSELPKGDKQNTNKTKKSVVTGSAQQ